MWRAIAYAEYVHARNHFKALGHLGSIQDNLQQSIEGENFEVQKCIQCTTTQQNFKMKMKLLELHICS